MNKQVRALRGLNGELVIVGAWCDTCRCEVMPSDTGYCCWCGRHVVDDETLPASAVRVETLPKLVPADRDKEITMANGRTRTCKHDGCEGTAPTHGRYAGLCPDHRGASSSPGRSSQPPLKVDDVEETEATLDDPLELARSFVTAVEDAQRLEQQLVEARSRVLDISQQIQEQLAA